MRARNVGLLIAALALSACGKPSTKAPPADSCAAAKGEAGLQTDDQAVQACRANKAFSGPDVKRSHIQITNH